MKQLFHHWPVRTRREFFTSAGTGLAAIALASLSADRAEGANAPARDPMEPRPPHHPPKAKSVIWLFMEGGPSHIDLFDPKPALTKLHGQPLPASFGKIITAMGTSNNSLMASPRTWKQYGQSGTW